MSTADESLELLFSEAIEFKDQHARERWLASVLGNDPEKLDELRELIAAYNESHWIVPPDIVEETRNLLENLKGQQVGPFLLVEKIGSGGMGDVYLAQQRFPVNRTVAIKLIQRDSSHAQIVHRFQQEKQMLANMEHPNIARIIDAGTTKSGISYIAMEYVHGLDLLEYCKRNRLDIKQRIELLLQCCRDPTCPSERYYPSRYKAEQCYGNLDRRRADDQGDRLWDCQSIVQGNKPGL